MNSKKYHRILNIPLQEKDDSQIIFGGVMILVVGGVVSILHIDFEFRIVIQLILVFLSTAWAVHRAEILNRNKIVWGILGFIFPPIALIILGLLETKIGVGPIKKIINEYRKKYEEKTSNIELPEKAGVQVKSKIYSELSIQLKKDISNKFTELNIQPDIASEPSETSSPSRFTIWIGGLIASLSSNSTKGQESNLNKARNGYVFNFVIVIIIIAVLVYVITKS